MRTAIGLDAGGTSTRAVLLEESGRALAVARTGAGNPTSAGPDLAFGNITEAVRQVVSAAGRDPEIVVLTAAGVSAAVEAGAHAAVASALPNARLHLEGDLVSAYWSAATEAAGAVLVVGTGAVAGRVEDGTLAQVSDGLGWLLGDHGSGFWIGRRIVRAVGRHLDGSGPTTALTEPLIASLAAVPVRDRTPRDERLERLLVATYAMRPVELARFAPLALHHGAGSDADPVAAQIVADACDRVVAIAEVVVGEQGPLVLAGGLLHAGSALTSAVQQRWPDRCRLAGDGTVGAGMLALRALGVDAGPSEQAILRRSITALTDPLPR